MKRTKRVEDEEEKVEAGNGGNTRVQDDSISRHCAFLQTVFVS